jgi:exosortase
MSMPVWSERWRLAALSREDLVKALLGALIIGWGVVLFHAQGNTTDPRAFGRSALLWMTSYWNSTASGIDQSHGWVIPLVSLGLVWHRRRDFAAAARSASLAGLGVVILALLLHWLGAKAQQTRVSLAGLILLVWGVPFHLFGWQVARLLIFPCAYLAFCIPLNFLDSMTAPLSLQSAAISASLLNGLGILVERSGVVLNSVPPGEFSFEVAEACSGIHSILAIAALSAVYGHLSQKTLLKKWLVFLSSIPLAIAGNVVRITMVVVVAKAFGEQLAQGLYHDYSGYVFFIVATLLMLGVGSLLQLSPAEAKARWKRAFTGPT